MDGYRRGKGGGGKKRISAPCDKKADAQHKECEIEGKRGKKRKIDLHMTSSPILLTGMHNTSVTAQIRKLKEKGERKKERSEIRPVGN